MRFLSEEWLRALDEAARARPSPDDDPLADVSLSIEQSVVGGPRWRLVIDRGSCRVDTAPEGEPDVRLSCDRDTAAAIAGGARSALDAFISGDLRLGGDTGALLVHREALAVLGDLFARVKARTTF